jgi:hypothetical protein
METETELMVAVRQGYGSDEIARPIFLAITELSKMLMSLRTRVLTQPRSR